ncbi:MAG TPA: MXAN_6640 family putative metalloprotease [Ignavibacteriaceae bacterium]|nr:MXAN_6640 family putative metalloprotease [Ignavibacteriaceae bacterium]
MITLFFISVKVNAQDLSSDRLDFLYNSFLSYKNVKPGGKQFFSNKADSSYIKCGFVLASSIKFNFERFTESQKKILSKLLQRPPTNDSLVSPSGHFWIHFNRTGFDAPNYNPALTAEDNAMQVAFAADSAYNFEVNYLGFPPPPSDAGETDERYDIYIDSPGGYGYTQPEFPVGEHIYSSFMVIHYEYQSGFYTHGLNAMRVTVAHEFHHAIQIGNYSYDDFDLDPFFYEMTSTSMEEFVFDDVNDYYGYLGSYFANPGKTFSSFRPGTNDGYDLAIWNLFLVNKFGFNIIKRQWELLRDGSRALEAIDISISEIGSTFKESLSIFGLWTYFTGKRSAKGVQQGFAFEEGNDYPLITPLAEENFTPPEDIFNLALNSACNNFIRVLDGSDTLVVLITNSDIDKAIESPDSKNNFIYGLYDHPVDNGDTITSYYFKTTSSSDAFKWSTKEIFNDGVIIRPIIVNQNPVSVFPVPYTYEKNGDYIRFIVNNFENTTVDFNVYTAGMELVYSNSMKLIRFPEIRGYVVSWTPLDNKNRRLASGVYLYIIKSGDNIQKGKFVVFNR